MNRKNITRHQLLEIIKKSSDWDRKFDDKDIQNIKENLTFLLIKLKEIDIDDDSLEDLTLRQKTCQRAFDESIEKRWIKAAYHELWDFIHNHDFKENKKITGIEKQRIIIMAKKLEEVIAEGESLERTIMREHPLRKEKRN